MNKPFKKIGYLGIITVVLVLLLQAVTYIKAGYLTNAVLELEFAKNPADVMNIFYEGGFDHQLVKAVNAANAVDFLFMAAYSLFLLAFLYKMYELSNNNKVFYYSLLAAPLVLLFDVLENIQMYAVTDSLVSGGFENNLLWLRLFTSIKWMALAAVFLVVAYFYYRRHRLLEYIFAGLSAVPFVAGLVAMFSGNLKTEFLFTNTIFLAFGLAFFYCFWYEEMPAS